MRPLGEDAVALAVDTYRDVHVAAVLCMLGAVMDTTSFPATDVGHRELRE
ncbi:hypothetical protein [Streptomyces violascens]